jgi:hypothetical protein
MINPSKRYTKQLAQKEASDLIKDVEDALKRKHLSSEEYFQALKSLQEVSYSIAVAIKDCKECKIGYSRGKIEGFCEKHEYLRVEYQKFIDEMLK